MAPSMHKLFYWRTILWVVLVSCASVTLAQSGRRGTTKPTVPVPSVSGPKEVETKPKPDGRIKMLLAVEDPHPLNNTPYYLTDTVTDACLQRLSEARDVYATPAASRMSRGEAIKLAKQEKERYVVWLQLGSDVADSGRQIYDGSAELYVNYIIYEPVTAKIKRQGRTYHNVYNTGNVGISGPTSRRPTYSEYAVRQAGRAAADKILAAFEIRLESRWLR